MAARLDQTSAQGRERGGVQRRAHGVALLAEDGRLGHLVGVLVHERLVHLRVERLAEHARHDTPAT